MAELITPVSWFIFRKLHIVGSFLHLPVCQWEADEEYDHLKTYVSTVKVVNDAAERGIKLCSDIIKKMTKNEGTRNDLCQVIENHRHTVVSKGKNNMLQELIVLGSNNNNE